MHFFLFVLLLLTVFVLETFSFLTVFVCRVNVGIHILLSIKINQLRIILYALNVKYFVELKFHHISIADKIMILYGRQEQMYVHSLSHKTTAPS